MNKLNNPLKKFLSATGLSDKEADVYLALLQLGQAAVSEIARKANINRTTGYVILDSLVNKGLVSVSGKEPKEEYLIESPDKIKSLIQAEINQKQENMKLADNYVPQLKSVHNFKKRPQVRFYEGKEGLKEVYEDTLTSHEPILAYASVEDTQHALPHYFPKYYKRRAAKKIPIRAIFPKTHEAVELAKRDKEELRTTALVPSGNFAFSPEINIYDNKVMIASWKENLGIILESQEIADAMKKIYGLAWDEAKRREKSEL